VIDSRKLLRDAQKTKEPYHQTRIPEETAPDESFERAEDDLIVENLPVKIAVKKGKALISASFTGISDDSFKHLET
jgi:hypothetical protein